MTLWQASVCLRTGVKIHDFFAPQLSRQNAKKVEGDGGYRGFVLALRAFLSTPHALPFPPGIRALSLFSHFSGSETLTSGPGTPR